MIFSGIKLLANWKLVLGGIVLVSALAGGSALYVKHTNGKINALNVANTLLMAEKTALIEQAAQTKKEYEEQINAYETSINYYVASQKQNNKKIQTLNDIIAQGKKNNEELKACFEYVLPDDIVTELFSFH
jgi:hypothetical protein